MELQSILIALMDFYSSEIVKCQDPRYIVTEMYVTGYFKAISLDKPYMIFRYSILFFWFNNLLQCSIAVHGGLSTTSSLHFLPQETENPFIGKETLLVITELKEKGCL